jgi:IS5 family transposase
MNTIPDATTIGYMRERLRKAGVIEDLFDRFEVYLRSHGLEARGDQNIDAALDRVAKQRNTYEENKGIKESRLQKGGDENP